MTSLSGMGSLSQCFNFHFQSRNYLANDQNLSNLVAHKKQKNKLKKKSKNFHIKHKIHFTIAMR